MTVPEFKQVAEAAEATAAWAGAEIWNAAATAASSTISFLYVRRFTADDSLHERAAIIPKRALTRDVSVRVPSYFAARGGSLADERCVPVPFRWHPYRTSGCAPAGRRARAADAAVRRLR